MTRSIRWYAWLCAPALSLFWPPTLPAHGLNVGQVELQALGTGRYHLSARFPDFAEEPQQVAILPANCRPFSAWPGSPGDRLELDGAFHCDGNAPPRLRFPWPNSTVLAVFERADGTRGERFINSGPEDLTVDFGDFEAGQHDSAETAVLYGLLGIEHILFGWDHLLFVTCLLLLARDWRRLLLTITAFTLAHSATLTLAVLDVVRVPPAPVEIVIALSVLFLASELARPERRRPTLTLRAPWLAAFGFGLLHGLGFAGALREIGLPPEKAPLALLSFNLGVEAGQVAFAAVALGVLHLLRRLGPTIPTRVEFATVMFAGIVSAYWVMERTHGLLTGSA